MAAMRRGLRNGFPETAHFAAKQSCATFGSQLYLIAGDTIPIQSIQVNANAGFALLKICFAQTFPSGVLTISL